MTVLPEKHLLTEQINRALEEARERQAMEYDDEYDD